MKVVVYMSFQLGKFNFDNKNKVKSRDTEIDTIQTLQWRNFGKTLKTTTGHSSTFLHQYLLTTLE